MKATVKKLGILALLSTNLLAFNGQIDFGQEFEAVGGHGDLLLPYVGVKVNPIEDSSLFIEGKYSYRYRLDEDRRKGDYRERFEGYVGYSFGEGDFRFTPKAGLRMNTYADDNKDETEYRFYPNMSYRASETLALSGSGFYAPVSTTGDSYDKGEYQVTARYSLADNQGIAGAFFTEFNGSNDYVENQFRVIYDYSFNNTTLTPYARIGLSRTENGETVDQGTRNRYGLITNQKISDTFSATVELYTETYANQDDDKFFSKVAFRKLF